MAKHNKIGRIGEEIACRFLKDRGFEILDRNYSKKWGEIDIVSCLTAKALAQTGETGEKDYKIRFVEVKTVSRENISSVSRETLERDIPEENVHSKKLRRLHRTIQSYLGEKANVSRETLDDVDWQLDIIVVFLDLNNNNARIRFTEDITMPE